MKKNGVEYPDVVDLVTADDAEVTLIIVQTETLGASMLPKLQDKINNYLSFAKDGQLHELYPETKDKDIVIRLNAFEEVDSEALGFFEIAAEVLAEEGVKFIWSKCKY
jgi:hypothetical protein